MVDLMSVREQVDLDYARARRRALVGRLAEELPPVGLYKIGANYFVHDGNHRVSVARFLGAEMIDAEVTEFFPNDQSGDSGIV